MSDLALQDSPSPELKLPQNCTAIYDVSCPPVPPPPCLFSLPPSSGSLSIPYSLVHQYISFTSHFILASPPRRVKPSDPYYSSHCTDEDIEGQRCEGTSQRSHSWRILKTTGSKIQTQASGSRAQAFRRVDRNTHFAATRHGRILSRVAEYFCTRDISHLSLMPYLLLDLSGPTVPIAVKNLKLREDIVTC